MTHNKQREHSGRGWARRVAGSLVTSTDTLWPDMWTDGGTLSTQRHVEN